MTGSCCTAHCCSHIIPILQNYQTQFTSSHLRRHCCTTCCFFARAPCSTETSRSEANQLIQPPSAQVKTLDDRGHQRSWLLLCQQTLPISGGIWNFSPPFDASTPRLHPGQHCPRKENSILCSNYTAASLFTSREADSSSSSTAFSAIFSPSTSFSGIAAPARVPLNASPAQELDAPRLQLHSSLT
jgi:hypothetical protein